MHRIVFLWVALKNLSCCTPLLSCLALKACAKEASSGHLKEAGFLGTLRIVQLQELCGFPCELMHASGRRHQYLRWSLQLRARGTRIRRILPVVFSVTVVID